MPFLIEMNYFIVIYRDLQSRFRWFWLFLQIFRGLWPNDYK